MLAPGSQMTLARSAHTETANGDEAKQEGEGPGGGTAGIYGTPPQKIVSETLPTAGGASAVCGCEVLQRDTMHSGPGFRQGSPRDLT